MERLFGWASAVLFWAAWVLVFAATWRPDSSNALGATAMLLFIMSGMTVTVWMALWMGRHGQD